ncbi:MAG: hypothetical protein ACFB02_02335 [Mastigocoleus sp.]
MRKYFLNRKLFTLTLCSEILIIVSALSRAWILDVNPKRYFDEGGYVSWFSFLQILVAAYFAWNIFKFRAARNDKFDSKNSHNIWLILSLGCLFLSFDELLALHEKLDTFIHYSLKIQETNLTDRIDSLIVLVYAIVGIGILYWAKYELRKFKAALPWFYIGLFLTFSMIFLDLLTDSKEFVHFFFTDLMQADLINDYIGIVEECCKLFAEGVFIMTLYRCLEISRSLKKVKEDFLASTD